VGDQPLTDPQRTYVIVLFHEYGITHRARRLEAMTRLARRPITSTNDLTRDEASRVINRLRRALGHDAPLESEPR
jgi:hypothetical protein